MRVSKATVAAAAALPSLTIAVTLSDFTPRVANLPSACQAVYTQQVSGCQSSDFTSGSGCSSACVEGLAALDQPVLQACGNQGISGENVIVAFLKGDGPESLCPNAASILQTSSSSAVIPSTSSAVASIASTSTQEGISTTSQIIGSTSVVTSSSSTPTTSAVVIAAPASTTSSSIFSASTTSTSSMILSVSSSTSAAASSSSITSALAEHTSSVPSTSQTMSSTSTSAGLSYNPTNVNDGSGGGSPFDSQGNLHSGASSAPLSLLPLILSAAIAACAMLR